MPIYFMISTSWYGLDINVSKTRGINNLHSEVTLVFPILTTKQSHVMQSDTLKVVKSVDMSDKISKAGNVDKYVQIIK